MRHAYRSGASASPPTPPTAPSVGYPTEGDTSSSTPATVLGAFWCHAVTEEIVSVIRAAGLTPSDATDQLALAIRTLSTPIGMMLPYAGAGAAPAGWLVCDGSAVSRATYARLYAVIGTTHGAGDGSTTFALPDLRRRAIVGSGGTASTELANTVGATGGAESHTLSVSEMPAHRHGGSTHATGIGSHSHGSGTLVTASESSHTHPADLSDHLAARGGDLNTMAVGERSRHENTDAGTPHNHGISGRTASTSLGSHSHTVNSDGGGVAHNNMPPSFVAQWLIFAGV